MLQAAIIEDEEEILSYLRMRLSQGFESEHLSVAFDPFTDGSAFLQMLSEHYHYDLVFLDIEMPRIDGLEVCRRIRILAPGTLVIFISGREELVYEAFEVQPFRFIPKSRFNERVPSLIRQIRDELAKRDRRMLKITEPLSGDVYSFDIRTVRYIEAQGKNCLIVTDSGETLMRCRLKDLEAQLEREPFLKPHRSYLVNCSCIFQISRSELILDRNERIPVSRGKHESVKKDFLRLS